MEKHPIDELFARELNNYKAEPSEGLRARFLDQLNKEEVEEKKVFPLRWFFAAAASLLIVGGFGWFYLADYSNQNNAAMEMSRNETPKMAPVPQPKIEESKDLEGVAKTVLPETKTLAISEKPKVAEKPIKASKPVLKKEEEYNPPVSATGVSEIDELIPDELTLALQNAQPKSKLKNENENKGLFRKSAGETIIIVSSDFEKEEQIFLPEVNADSQIALSEAEDFGEAKLESDKSFLAKVFTELKHLKHGEKVDFDEFSARNSSSTALNEDTFIGNETQEMRQRLRWIKDRFSKE